MKLEIPDETPLIKIQQFAASVGCDVTLVQSKDLKLTPKAELPDNVRVLQRPTWNGNGPSAA